MPFNKDFGPLNLSMTHRFCRELQKLLKSESFQGTTRIYHYTKSTDYAKITNSAYLMCAFMIVILKMDAGKFQNIKSMKNAYIFIDCQEQKIEFLKNNMRSEEDFSVSF